MEVLQIVMALLPFAVMLVGFIVFKADALKLSFIVWILELVICLGLYQKNPLELLNSSIWGNVTLWTGFLVLWSGQIFGACYRNTGLLDVLLSTLGKIMPTKEGKAVTLVTVVGGYLGAFNGFATYPVTIPGLKKLGVPGLKAAGAYLVYFAWNISFVSLFVAANIATGVTKIPIEQIIQVMGLVSIPLCIVSTLGFFFILKLDLKNKDNRAIAILTMVGNVLAVVLFTQVIPDLYLLTLVASATFCLIALKLYSRKYDKSEFDQEETAYSTKDVIKAFGPLVCCMLLVILFSYPLKGLVTATTFSVALFGYTATSVNWLNSPGFLVLITALLCFLFVVDKRKSLGACIAEASKRSAPSLLTLLCGGAMVQLMLDTSQISLLATSMAAFGAEVYAVLLGGLSFLCGMAFGQGMPAVRMLAAMQMPMDQLLGIAPVILVGIATTVCMGSANPLKPSLLKYTSSLADIKGEDGKLFNICLPWELIALGCCVVATLILINIGYLPAGA